MIRMQIHQLDGVSCPCVDCASEAAWGDNVERGLFVQKHHSPLGIVYGVTHHSGLVVAPTYYRYSQAVALHQRLLGLPVDWTQAADRLHALYPPEHPERARIAHLAQTWEEVYAIWAEPHRTPGAHHG